MRATFNRLASGLKNYLGPAPVTALPVDDRPRARFVDVQRRLMIYLRALWECDFVIKQGAVDSLGEQASRPFIEHRLIYLPDVFFDAAPDDARCISGLEIYRAAATHAAAHLRYRKKHYSARAFDKWQIAVISLVEDARVETLAGREFPGLKSLWARQHRASAQDGSSAGDYLNRMARALLDESYRDDDPWIGQGRALFAAIDDLQDEQISRTVGLQLAASFLEKKIRFDYRADTIGVPYRDDNRYLWRRQSVPLELFSTFFLSKSAVGREDDDKVARKHQNPTIDETASAKALATHFYPEWNYRSGSEDPSWVTLRERTPARGDLGYIDNIVAENRHLIARMKTLLRAIRDGAAHRVRKLEDGDEIDINAAVRAQIDIRLGVPPDPRIMMRSSRKTRDISVLVLLDLSRSMNNRIKGREHTALQLTQQVSVLFAEAIAAVGDPFAIHGFYSDTRHFVEYFCLKNFDQPYDDGAKAAIAGMTGKRGTRMGAAVRHATYYLNKQKSGKKLLLIITDGEPSDVDAPSRQYLHDDTRKSVEDAKRNGIHTYCISLDPAADQYVSRIFGATNYMVVDHVKCLPEKVLLIYAGLSH